MVWNTDCDCDDGDAVVINFHNIILDSDWGNTHLIVMMVMVGYEKMGQWEEY